MFLVPDVIARDFPRLRLPGSSRVASALRLVTFINGDPLWTMRRQLAYFMATVQWETAHTFEPIRERRAGIRQAEIRRRQDRYWNTGFYGRGLVQLTWRRNYARAGRLVFPNEPDLLVHNPDLLLDPIISYEVASKGMIEGIFTGRKLDDYIVEGRPPDYYNARRIVNGLNRAQDIANIANTWELIIRAATAQEG